MRLGRLLLLLALLTLLGLILLSGCAVQRYDANMVDSSPECVDNGICNATLSPLLLEDLDDDEEFAMNEHGGIDIVDRGSTYAYSETWTAQIASAAIHITDSYDMGDQGLTIRGTNTEPWQWSPLLDFPDVGTRPHPDWGKFWDGQYLEEAPNADTK